MQLSITTVTASDLPELMPMLRAYCDFYEVDPSDERLATLANALIENPDEGVQLIARGDGAPLGFATIFWTWQTLYGARVGVLNDLYVNAAARGSGTGRALIERGCSCAANAGPRSSCGRRRPTMPRPNGSTTASARRSRPG